MSRSYSIGSPNMSDILQHTYVWTVFFTHETKKDLRNITMNGYQFVFNNESNKNTNVKSDINKLSINKRCHFLEIIVPTNETSELLHSNGVGNTWYTSDTAENWTWDATNTQTLESLVHTRIWSRYRKISRTQQNVIYCYAGQLVSTQLWGHHQAND
jgi:hypothetical protein